MAKTDTTTLKSAIQGICEQVLYEKVNNVKYLPAEKYRQIDIFKEVRTI